VRESLTRQTLKGAAWIGGASVIRLGLRIVSVAILGRLLTPQEYGIVAGALIAMDFAAMVYGMGLAPTLIQRKDVRPDHVATAFSSALFMAVLAAAGMWYAAPLIADVMQIPELTQILKVLAWLTPLGAFTVLCEALLARHMQLKSVALRPLFSFTIATLFVAIPMAWYGFGYWSLVAMQAADTVVGMLTLGFAARRLLARPGFSRQAFNELWQLSLGFTLNQPFGYVARNVDKFLIGRFVGADSLGLYTRASFITTTAANLFGNITRLSVFPAMAQVQEDNERLRNALLKSLSVVAFLTLPATAFCIVFAKELVGLLLGRQWHAAVNPFAILSGALYLRLAWRLCAAVFQALGRPNRITAVHLLRAAALILCISFAQPYGLAAISAAVVVVLALVVAIMFAVVTRDIDLSFHRLAAAHLQPVVISVAVLGVGLTLKASLADIPGPVLLAIALAVVLVSLLPLILIQKRRVLGSYNIALLRRMEGGL
jgi:O-antigen/teichoic acid export membrane protein